MNNKIIINNECDYKEYINYLFSLQDLKYRDFHKSLVLNSKYKFIGIRTNIMHSIAKRIDNIENLFKYSKNEYYEEILIQGFVISNIKDEKIFYKYFKRYINKVDNWALCDMFCSSIKIIKKYKNKYFKISCDLALNKKEFKSRIGYVLILDYFIEESNLNIIFDLLNNNNDKFYVNMAKAWLICELYIKYKEQTLEFIKNNKLNTFTLNKSISKIHDSFRVSEYDKNILNSYRK